MCPSQGLQQGEKERAQNTDAGDMSKVPEHRCWRHEHKSRAENLGRQRRDGAACPAGAPRKCKVGSHFTFQESGRHRRAFTMLTPHTLTVI